MVTAHEHPALTDRVTFREVAEAQALAGRLFVRSFGHSLPATPHHVVAMLRDASGADELGCYVHFAPHGDVLLGGGACVDRRLLRRVPASTREALRAAGGLYAATLSFALAHFAPRWFGVFGYCGDRLAERVDRAMGFRPTGHPHLLVAWLHPLTSAQKERRVAEVAALGAF